MASQKQSNHTLVAPGPINNDLRSVSNNTQNISDTNTYMMEGGDRSNRGEVSTNDLANSAVEITRLKAEIYNLE